MEFALTRSETIFLVAAIIVTIPMVVLVRWIILELRKENASGRNDIGPETHK